MDSTPPPTPWGAAVLCGGRSRRMGRPKALLPWKQGTLLEHVVGVLQEAVDSVVVVSSRELEPHLPPLSVPLVLDREPALGPLAGIREALEATPASWCYVTSTDAPFLTAEFVRWMLAHQRAAAPTTDGFVQPLAAVYPKSGAQIAERLLQEERRRPLFLLEACDFLPLGENDLPHQGPLRNLNTPKHYLDSLEQEGVTGPVTVEFFGLAREKAAVAQWQTTPATLGTLLGQLAVEFPRLELGNFQEAWPRHYLFSLNGRAFVSEPNLPVAPGESLVITDAAVGG